MTETTMVFAGYPDAVVYRTKQATKKMAVQHLIWGDEIHVLKDEGNWIRVRARRRTGWMRKHDTMPVRLLEIYFVDVGQGDGCIVVLPDNRRLVIDAGDGDNMERFLSWRFDLRKIESPVTFHAAVVSHPDQDHYYGFRHVFQNKMARFERVYHNGIVERKADGNARLGRRSKNAEGEFELRDVVADDAKLRQIVTDKTIVGSTRYAATLKKAITNGVGEFRMLWSPPLADDGAAVYMPGFDATKDVAIQVLGPVPAQDNGSLRLKWFGDVGKTKNGHSVVLRLTYGGITAFLGGDLNIPAEDHLLMSHVGTPFPPDPGATGEFNDNEQHKKAQRDEYLAGARAVFGCDLTKSCHHGSADFSHLFLESVNARATIISSGDDNSHSHPRPDALGAIGKLGRGRRPLIFNTEIARSGKERIKHPRSFKTELRAAAERFHAAKSGIDEGETAKAKKAFDKLMDRIDRSVAVYGMINVRTDGDKLLFAQKLEKKRSNASKWDLYEFERDADGELHYESKH